MGLNDHMYGIIMEECILLYTEMIQKSFIMLFSVILICAVNVIFVMSSCHVS